MEKKKGSREGDKEGRGGGWKGSEKLQVMQRLKNGMQSKEKDTFDAKCP